MLRGEYEQLSTIQGIDDTDYERLSNKINQICDPIWMYEVASAKVNINPLIDWHDWLKQANLPESYLIPAQEHTLAFLNGYTNPSTGRIKVASRTEGTLFKRIFRLFSLLYAHEKNYNKWIKFSFEDIQSIIITETDRIRKSKLDDVSEDSNAGFLFVRDMIQVLNVYTSPKGRLISPFSSEEMLLLTGTDEFTEDYLERIGLTYAQFSRSKKGEAIPNYISMHWITYIIDTFNSDFIKFARLHFLLRREFPEPMHVRAIIGRFEQVLKLRSGTIYKKHGKLFDEVKERSEKFDLYSQQLFGDKIQVEPYLDFLRSNFINAHDQQTLVYNLMSHLYSAILLTNGPRKSEANTLQLSDFKEITKIESEYKSYIHKTMNGLPTIRSISGYVHDLAEKSADIGTINRFDENVLLFHTQPAKSSADVYREYGTMFNHSYQLFLDSLPEDEAKEIREDVPRVHTHQGRHSFFGYALRIGDHNTYEAIRKHARHEYLSFMTSHYTEGKIRDKERRSLEREYVTEIVGRIVNKEEHGYFGPMLKTIETLISENIDFIDGTSKEELKDLGDKVADHIERIKVNEFGMCVPVFETLEKSQCWDKSTKTPQYDEGSTFHNCSGCIHYLGMTGFIEDIQRHAISITTMLDNLPVISKKLRQTYELELKRAETLLAEGKS